MGWNLNEVDSWSLDWAHKAIEKRDGAGFASTAYSTNGMLALVFDNMPILQEHGMYEAAMVQGFTGCKMNNCRWSMGLIEWMFSRCDRATLRAVGSPLPGPGPFTLYRGVSGAGSMRRVRGLSWTASIDVACWFAIRFRDHKDFANPAIYAAMVTADDVLCYVTDRDEDEFIVRPKRAKRLPMSEDEMGAACDRERARRKERAEIDRERMKAQIAAMSG